MRRESANADAAAVLASAPVAGAGTADVTLTRTGASWARLSLPRFRVALGPAAGRAALLSLVLSAAALVAFTTAGPSVLVPRSNEVFPGWEAGPLHGLFSGLPNDPRQLSYGMSALVIVMLIAYGAAIASARALSMRVIVVAVVALHAILLLGPPTQLTDLFNYLGYARLGGLHHLNPYTHVVAQELHDPVYRFATWHHLHSPYGPLFTALSYLLPLGSMAASYWLLKTVTVLASLAFLALVWRCARALGRDPRYALVFVAFNPIYLVYAVGGFHNDFFMLVPSMAAIALLLARRDRTAGAVLMLAVAVKFTAILLLPFLIVAVAPARVRMRHIVEGAVAAAIPLAILSLAVFGLSMPNLQDQSTLLTDFSIPNVLGLVLGVGGGTPTLLRIIDVAVFAAVVVLLRRRGEWISRAGWATLALIVSLAWLMPWYVIWLAPLAALGSSNRLRCATLALTLFLVLTFVPATGLYLSIHGISPLATPAGQASKALQHKLS
jgi:alpha-1,6-mannosyltransferase